MADGALKKRYMKLVQDRRPYLDRARICAKLTIPSLIPDEGHNSTTTLVTPWQSLGAKGVNNLASKMLLALFSPSQTFFRLTLDEVTIAELGASKGEVEKGMAAIERVVMGAVENSTSRSSLFEGLKHLIVAGNVLYYENPESGNVRMYPISRYVVKRTPDGDPYEMITEDVTTWGALDGKVREALKASYVPEKGADDPTSIYTGIVREGNSWKVWQEIEGVPLDGSQGSYPVDSCPWIPVRRGVISGEHYGRSYVEEIYGDVNTVDALQQAITEGASISSIVKFLIDPNGVTDAKDIRKTPNGGVCSGREQDISVLQVNKFADMRVAREHLQELKADLSAAFLMHTSIQRNAERVTAEEIRYMAQELEDALGGIYSLLAQELQLPLVNSVMRRLQQKKKLPPLPKSIQPKIITGLEALGRNHEHARLRMFVGDAAQTFGPEAVIEYVTVDEYLRRSAAAMNIVPEGLVRTDAEVQQRRQQQMEQAAQIQAQAQAQAQAQTQGGQ